MLESPAHCLDNSIGVEEEDHEVVRGKQGGRLQAQMAAVMKELRAQRMGIGTFIRAWVEQDETHRTRRIGLLRKLASQDPVLREAFGIDEVNTSTGGNLPGSCYSRA
jgi:hypothetical protein